MKIDKHNWTNEELDLELISNTYNDNSNSDVNFHIKLSIKPSEDYSISLPMEDDLFLFDLKDSLNKLLLHNYKEESLLLFSTEGTSNNDCVECFVNTFVTKEEVGEPLIDKLFISIERFDYEIKKYVYDTVSLQTSYRITFGLPLYTGSSIFKSIIINDLSEDKVKELYDLIDSFTKTHLLNFN